MILPFTTFDEMRDTILTWCNSITGRTVVLANAGEGAKPGVPYVMLFISTHETPGIQTEYLSEDGLTETVYSVTRLTANLDLYGGNAMQDASALIRSLKSQTRWLDLYKICGLGGVREMRDLTFLETASRKQRAQVLIDFYCLLSNTFTADYATSLPITLIADNKTVAEDLPGGEDPHQAADICGIE